MILPIRRVVVAACAAVALLTVTSRPAEAAACGVVTCAVKITAEPGSGISILDIPTGFPGEDNEFEYHPLDSVPVALLAPGANSVRDIISRHTGSVEGHVTLRTERLAGNLVRVSMTARLYQSWPGVFLAAKLQLRPITLQPGQTAETNFTLWDDDEFVSGRLVLASRLVPVGS